MRAGFTLLRGYSSLCPMQVVVGMSQRLCCHPATAYSGLMKAGSSQPSIHITKAPSKPSLYCCCFQEHTQFTIWPWYSVRFKTDANQNSSTNCWDAKCCSHRDMIWLSRPAPALHSTGTMVLQPARCHRPPVLTHVLCARSVCLGVLAEAKWEGDGDSGIRRRSRDVQKEWSPADSCPANAPVQGGEGRQR